jgi:ATP-dependent RNA helicase DDX46/PRP5
MFYNSPRNSSTPKLQKNKIKMLGEESAPFAIQQQAIPAVMSGRDLIGIAKTGSGKTLAFLLPMIRHILDQPLLEEGEGPIGLIMAPARELAIQISKEVKRVTKALDLRVTAVYGGASVADQIGDLKRGSEIVVCTPGRMIDILTMQAGKLISFSRVSFVVLDEADRMFDMGFEPQIRMILNNIRPDRQTCLFSATFPQKVEELAKKALTAPIEVVVGGRSVVNTSITQFVEVREEEDKFMRLLQLLGVWYERGHVIIFTNTQAKCERLFEELMRAGYPCLSVHGGKDQLDRDDAIASFKNKVRTLMVATSVVGRGMDVQECVCVINYSCPNHLEEYVHRVGRTGRAGRTGTAYTFITPEEEQYAPLLVKALTQSQQEVPKLLEEMADEFRKKIDTGSAKWATSGYGGTGYNYFDPSEKSAAQKQLDMQRRQYEVDQGLRDSLHSEDEQEDYDQEDYDGDAKEAAQATAHAAAQASSSSSSSSVVLHGAAETPLARAQRYAAQVANTHTFLFYFIFVKVMLLFDMCTMVEIYVSPFQNFFFFGLLHH